MSILDPEPSGIHPTTENPETLLLFGGNQEPLPGVAAEIVPIAHETDHGGDVASDLASRLQLRLAFDRDTTTPAVQRELAELAPHAWCSSSTRRSDPEFQHPPAFAFLVELDSRELSTRVGWIRKRKLRGLTPLDVEVIREWRARSLSFRDLFGLDVLPQIPAVLAEALRRSGIRSHWAARVCALLLHAIRLRRLGLSLSAPEARSLYAIAPSTWWRVIGLLEGRGWVVRVGLPKPNPDGAAPVHDDTNVYVPGPVLLQLAGVHEHDEDAIDRLNAREHAGVLARRRARRRAERSRVRDRNRLRLRELGPHVVTTPAVERAADRLAARRAELVGEHEQQHAIERARAMLAGEAIELGGSPPAELDAPTLACDDAEAVELRARAEVDRANRSKASASELPSEFATPLPEGRQKAENFFRARARSSTASASSHANVGASSSAGGDRHSLRSWGRSAAAAGGRTFAGPDASMPTTRSRPTSPDARAVARDELGFEPRADAPATFGAWFEAMQLGRPPPGGPAFAAWLADAERLASSASSAIAVDVELGGTS